MRSRRYSPESLAKAYRHFWFAVARSQDLDSPRPATLLGEPLVVFRGADGEARVMSSRCVHRGGDLSAGQVIGNAIQCPYHGWEFDGTEGRCTRIPSMGDNAKIPANAAVRPYPAVERFGHVWTCLDEPVLDLPEPPELNGLELDWRTGTPIPVNCGFMAATENFRDVAHFPFVHHGSMGDVAQVVPPLEVTREGHEVRASFRYDQVDGGEYSSLGDTWMHYHSYAPGIAAIFYDYASTGHRYLIDFPSPVGPEQCVIYWAAATDKNFTAATIDEIHELETRVFNEDTPILEGLRPREITLGREAFEVSCPADLYTLNYRRASRHAINLALDFIDRREATEASAMPPPA